MLDILQIIIYNHIKANKRGDVKKMERGINWEDLPLMLTPAQAAKVLHLNPVKVRALAQANVIPSLQITAKYIIPRDVLRTWIEESSRIVNLPSEHLPTTSNTNSELI